MSYQPFSNKESDERSPLWQDTFHILFPSQNIMVHDEKRTLVLLHPQSECSIIEQFSTNEWKILICLLDAFPQCALHEQLLTCITALPFALSREQLQHAREADELAKHAGKDSRLWEQEFRPVSRALIKLREKLKRFSLVIVPARGLGYSLTAAPETAHMEMSFQDNILPF